MSQIDARNADKAQPLRGGGTNGEPIRPSENGFNDHVKNFSHFLGGVYFGNPLTKKRADSRIYSDTNISDSDAHKYTFFLLNGEQKLSETSELDFLYSMFVFYSESKGNATPDLKIRELAALAGAKEKEGEEFFYVTAVRNNDAGGLVPFNKQADVLRNNFGIFHNTSDSFFLGIKDDNSLKSLGQIDRNNQKEAIDRLGIKERLIARYQMVSNNKSFDGSETESIPRLKLLKFIPSKIKNFYKRAVKRFSSGYSETELFLKNVGDLNPQFEGPFITTDIRYYRPPKKEDFDIGSGVDSISISQGQDGISTSVKYSSRKFGQVDESITTEFLGSRSNIPVKRFEPNAFQKNAQGN